MKRSRLPALWLLACLLLSGCAMSAAPDVNLPTQAALGQLPETAVNPPSPSPTLMPFITATPSAEEVRSIGLPASPTPIPTIAPTLRPTSQPTNTPTPLSPCAERIPTDDLFILVTRTYGLSRDYEPQDLVPIADHLPVTVTLGYPTQVRQVIVEPLVQMVNDMLASGLQPQIISGYRSYAAQSIAWDKWHRENPESAAIVSAPPGYSEHQLGTVVDFGSPELPDIVGIEDIEFHTYFFMTSEGIWLAENAHRYGFTLSYPREAFEITGFYYEPWHYRYVGQEMAARLKEIGMSLTEYQLINQPTPCIP